MGYGWLVNDVMTFWQQLCLDVHFGRMTQDAATNSYAVLIDAYRELRPLSDQELAAVPYLSLGWWMFYSGFHTTHDQFYTFIEPSHLKLRFGLIRQLIEKYCRDESESSAAEVL
jgi:Ser/Thr protein kinase RdoA (MazF antagonist)